MKIKVSLAFEKSLVERLDKIAKIGKKSRSEVVQQMVMDAVEDAEQFALLVASPEARKLMVQTFGNKKWMEAFGESIGAKVDVKTRRKMAEKVASLGQSVEEIKGNGGRHAG